MKKKIKSNRFLATHLRELLEALGAERGARLSGRRQADVVPQTPPYGVHLREGQSRLLKGGNQVLQPTGEFGAKSFVSITLRRPHSIHTCTRYIRSTAGCTLHQTMLFSGHTNQRPMLPSRDQSTVWRWPSRDQAMPHAASADQSTAWRLPSGDQSTAWAAFA